MPKTWCIILLSVITAITLFLGVFCFIPTFPVGEYEEYYSPSSLIQKANGFTDSVEAHYIVELDDGVEFNAVKRVIRARLRGAYGYYGSSISYEDGIASITVPVRDNSAKTNVDEILNNIVANGKVEILNSTSYSADNVVLTQKHFRRATVRSYVNGDNTWILVEIKLTKEGTQIANNLIGTSVTSLSNYFAVDGNTDSYYDYSNGTIRLYTHTQEEAKLLASYVNHGALNATLTDGDPQVEKTGLGFIFFIVLALLFVASVVYLTIRYKDLGLVVSLGHLIAIDVFTIFAGLVYMEILNVFAAIGIILVYAFMVCASTYTLEKIRTYRESNKTYASARYKAFFDTTKLSLIAHGGLLVLGIILWVIPSVVTAPLGNVLVYGAILSFIVTFGLNRLFTHWLAPFHEGVALGSKK